MRKWLLVLILMLILPSVSVPKMLYDGTDYFYNKIYDINNRSVIFDKNEMILNPNGVYFSPKNKKQKVLECKVKPYLSLPTSIGDIIDSFTGFDAKIFFHF